MNRRPILIASVAIAVVAVAGIAFVALGGLGSGTPEATPSPSQPAASPSPSGAPSDAPTPEPTEAPTPTPEPSQEAGPITVSWTPGSGIEPDAMVGDVAYLDGRFVAVGGAFDSDNLTAAIWTSEDGVSWTRAEITSTRAANEYTNVVGVVEIDGDLLAYGSWGVVPSDQRSWMTWRSTDGGATWTESREGPTPGALAAVAIGGPGLVAAGWNVAGVTPFDSYVLTSADGITWEHVADLPQAQVQDVAVIGDRFVAVGHTWTATGDTDAAAWYSDDGGATWTPVDMPDGGSSLSVASLAPFGDVLVAVGDGGRSDVALFVTASWVTTDGASWEVYEVASGAFGRAVAAVDGGLVAAGNFGAHDIGPGVAWTSTDGQTWIEGDQLGDGTVRLSGVAGTDDVVVAVGECQSTTCDTVVWVGEVSR